MRRVFRNFSIAILAYSACWLTAHSSVMLLRGDGASLDYLLSYFAAAWSLSGGEIPTAIWLLSSGLYSLFLLGWLGCRLSRRRRSA
jgi:hypothetical protein